MPRLLPATWLVIVFAMTFGRFVCLAAEPSETWNVWPNEPPGDLKVNGQEHILENRPRPFYQITDVSTPTVAVFRPDQDKQNGTAVLVCPGGGLQRLAIEHEGFEVARWLAEQGITAFVLKYRVPAPAEIGLQDAQRALSVIRSQAAKWNIDPDCIGCIGFSAGAEICAWLATHHEARQYADLDEHDQHSCRPDFAALIYPGGLVGFRSSEVKEAIASKLNKSTPTFFIAHAFDDASLNSLEMAVALKKAQVPTELHVYQFGAHGFGARKTGQPLDAWRATFVRWAESNGFMDAAWVRQYAVSAGKALQGDAPIPRVPEQYSKGRLDDYFAIQRRMLRPKMTNDRVVGFKGGAMNKTDQSALGISHPLVGVLFHSDRLEAKDQQPIAMDVDAETVLATEIGFIIDVDIAYEVPTVEQAKSSVKAIVPVIEMTKRYNKRLGGEPTLAETIALNVSASRFLVGDAIDPTSFVADEFEIRLSKDEKEISLIEAKELELELWQDLHALLNQAVERGYTIPAGSVILSGALGQVHVAEPGKYQADFGDAGRIIFELTLR